MGVGMVVGCRVIQRHTWTWNGGLIQWQDWGNFLVEAEKRGVRCNSPQLRHNLSQHQHQNQNKLPSLDASIKTLPRDRPITNTNIFLGQVFIKTYPSKIFVLVMGRSLGKNAKSWELQHTQDVINGDTDWRPSSAFSQRKIPLSENSTELANLPEATSSLQNCKIEPILFKISQLLLLLLVSD